MSKAKTNRSGKRNFRDVPAFKPENRDRYVDFSAVILILALGIYNSIVYWGHQPVPHFDYNAFVNLARDILSFESPDSFKRIPLAGMLFILFGKIAGGECSAFHGAWLLNSVLYPLNGVLFYFVGKRFIGKAAFFFALVAMLNPWVVQLLTEAIVETTLLCGFVLSFWLMLKRSRWVYLAAGATAMIRYEGALLIMAAFILDMIYNENNKQRLKSFLFSALASVPLALWMLATLLHWQRQGETHYLKEFGSQSGGKIIFGQYIKLMWEVTFKPLLVLSPSASKASFSVLFLFNGIFAGVGFTFGLVYAFIKKNCYIIVLTVVLVLYLLIHAIHSWTFRRFCMPVAWIGLLVFLYGLWGLWDLIKGKKCFPGWLIIVSHIVLSGVVLCWSIILLLNITLPRWEGKSLASSNVWPVVLAVLVVSFLVRLWFYKTRNLSGNLLVHLLFALLLISNQFTLASVVGKGERDIEFKRLVDWYLENTNKTEKMALSVPYIIETMAPDYGDNFISVNRIDANNPVEFIIGCYRNDIKYVAWDSRIGLRPKNRCYRMWNMKNIAPLIKPSDNGPYEFITILQGPNRERYINLFKLKPLPAGVTPSMLERHIERRY